MDDEYAECTINMSNVRMFNKLNARCDRFIDGC